MGIKEYKVFFLRTADVHVSLIRLWSVDDCTELHYLIYWGLSKSTMAITINQPFTMIVPIYIYMYN